MPGLDKSEYEVRSEAVRTYKDSYVTLRSGLKVHYVETGPADAPVLLLTHGFLGSWRDWRYNLAGLAWNEDAPRRVIALDWVGFGNSDKPTSGYSISFYADLLRDFADALRLDEFDLMGHSMGGKYNLAFAILYPDYVRSLILVASDGYSKDPWWINRTESAWFRRVLDGMVKMFGNPNFIRRNMSRVFYSPKFHYKPLEIERTARELQRPEQVEAIKALTFSYSSLSFQRSNLANRLGEISCPTMILWGKDDKMLPVSSAYQFQQAIPGAKAYLFKECGHMPQIEKAGQFNRLVLNFLALNEQAGRDKLAA